MSKRIVYVGMERGDFPYYLATVLSTTESILVIDNSYAGDLFRAVNKTDDTTSYESGNVTYVRNLDVSASEKNLESGFDLVLIYAGTNIDETYFAGSDLTVFVMPDYTKPSLDMAASIPYDLSSENVVIIMRDYCSKKISEKSVSILFGVTPDKISGKIPLSLQDIAAYVSLTHNGKQNIRGLSDYMQEAITYAVAKVSALDRKSAAKAVTAAKKMK